MSQTQRRVVCAHSPDSDDAFMFYGLANEFVTSPIVKVEHLLSDIQTLNEKATQGVYELTAISYHAFAYVADKYRLMRAGSSVGDDYGPMIVTAKPIDGGIKGKRVAVPGKMTTAYLTARLYEPDFEAVVVPFDQIIDAVTEGSVDAGVIIHEGQLTFARSGLHLVDDLGVWWKKKHGLPLPLGANALRRDLPDDVQAECCRLMREGIAYSLANRDKALAYAMQFARDMETSLADRFVGMYVNHHTIDCGDDVPRAAQLLLESGYEAGIIPHRVNLEWVGDRA